MSETYRWIPWTIIAGVNLTDTRGTGHRYKAFAADDGQPAANGNEAVGILQYTSNQSEHATIGVSGLMKFTAGVSMGLAVKLTVAASGYFTIAGSGDPVVGKSLEAVDSGEIGFGVFNFGAATRESF